MCEATLPFLSVQRSAVPNCLPMAERQSCAVYIGGAVPEHVIPELAQAINATGGGPDWGSSPYRLTHDEIADAEGYPFPVLDDQANLSAMRSLEMFLLTNKIDFDRLTSAGTDSDAYLLRGRTIDGEYASVETLSTSDGEPALVFDEIEVVLASSHSVESIGHALRRALGTHLPDLEPLTIVERAVDSGLDGLLM